MLDTTFSALADPTRRAILEALAGGGRSVGALSEPFAISAPAISRHLNVLEAAGLITNTRYGKGRLCTLVPAPLVAVRDWTDFQARFWSDSLDRLHDFVKQEYPDRD